MLARAVVGRDGRARLANAMRGTVRQACLVAPCANTIAEAERRERSAELGHDEREVANWRRVDARFRYSHAAARNSPRRNARLL